MDANRNPSQQTLPGYEPTEADMVREAMARPLAEKVSHAIDLLRLYEPVAKSLSDSGYWLAYSGGKDSEVILDLANRAGVEFGAHYSVTTLDPPELVRFIRRAHPEVVWHRQPKAMLSRMLDRSNGPPTRKARWCCAEYKEQGGTGQAKIIGVRAAESRNRARLWSPVVPHRTAGVFVCPIVYWTDADVWDYHRDRGLEHCELYDQGFRRLGCIGCPMAGAKGVAREFARWPGYARWWEQSVKAFWKRHHNETRQDGRPLYVSGFASADEYWDWWRSGSRRQAGDDCQMRLMFT